MVKELREIQASAGAMFEVLATGETVAVSFGNEPQAIAASYEGVGICDRSHWGVLQISGEDRLRFLHNQSTNMIQNRQPTEGCDTVFVTSTARTIDLVTAYFIEDRILLLVSPNRRQQLFDWMDRYIFPMDRVQLKDCTTDYGIFSLIGEGSYSFLEKLGLTFPQDKGYGYHQVMEWNGTPVRVAVGSGLAIPGYTFMVPAGESATFWKTLTTAGAVPLGTRIWEHLRIKQGRPAPDFELTEAYNPLEAGLWNTISFEKGCYIGQETIARLNTYKGVKQRLWGIRLSGRVEPGTPLTVEDEKVGQLTSYTELDQEPFGLGYIRTKAGEKGLNVKAGEVEGEVVEIPFITHPSQSD